MWFRPKFGSFKVLDEIAVGAEGTVYRGWDRPNRRIVAVKQFDSRAGEIGVWRTMREQRVTFHHPNVIEVHDFGIEGTTPYLVTEYLEAGDLDRYCSTRGHLRLSLALALAEDIFTALAVVHDANVLHRDVKPSNILLRGGGDRPVAILSDFSSAWVDDGRNLTISSHEIGTPEYWAPELRDGDHRHTRASDVFAVGLTLRQMLTGGAVDQTLPRDAVLVPVGNFIDRLCAPDPSKRPTARDAAATCRAMLADARSVEPPDALVGAARIPPAYPPPPDPNRARKLVAGATALAVLNGCGFYFVTMEPGPPPLEVARVGQVAWSLPTYEAELSLAVSDDGTVYSADPIRGVVYRHTREGVVVVAGGGARLGDEGPAVEMDLAGPIRKGGIGGVFNPTVPYRWTLSVAHDGTLWINNGDIWRVDRDGAARRVVAVTDTSQDRPYRVWVFNHSRTLPTTSVLDGWGEYYAEASTMQMTQHGVAYLVQTHGGTKIVEADDGRVVTRCDLTGVRASVPRAKETTISDRDGVDLTAAGIVAPDWWVMVGANECLVTDSASHELIHVKDGVGATVGFGWNSSSDYTSTLSTTSTAPPDVVTEYGSSVKWSAADLKLVGMLPGGHVLLDVGYQMAELTAEGAVVRMLDRAVERVDILSNLTGPTKYKHEAPLSSRAALSGDGTRFAVFAQDGNGLGDNRPDVPAPRVALLSGRTERMLADGGIVYPEAVAKYTSLSYGVRSTFNPTSGYDAPPVVGTPGDLVEVVESDLMSNDVHIANSGDEWVSDFNSKRYLYRVKASPSARLEYLADLGAGGPGGDSNCDILAMSPNAFRGKLAVLCSIPIPSGGWSGLRVVSVDVHSGRAVELVSAKQVDAAQTAYAAAHPKGQFGPGFQIAYTSSGDVIVDVADDGLIYRVDRGRLVLTHRNDFDVSPSAAERRHTAALKKVADDPVLLRAFLREDERRPPAGVPFVCSKDVTAPGPYTNRGLVALSRTHDVMIEMRCLVERTNGAHTRFDTGTANPTGFAAVTASGDYVYAYSSADNVVWRFDRTGGHAEIVAGRRGYVGTSPDGVKAAGSPIAPVLTVIVDAKGEPCFNDTELNSLRCVDARGALTTVVGRSPRADA
ncbi:MAG: serine/threonine-protein kinase [Acidimicrobiales bacterium]